MTILKLLQFHLFIADFNLLSWESDSFKFNYRYDSFFIKKTKFFFKIFYNTFTVFCEKSKTLFFPSSIMKNIVVFPPLSKFAIKLIC